jgi:hypothetical protein
MSRTHHGMHHTSKFKIWRDYGVPREEVVDSLVGLLRKRNIEAIDAEKALVAGALLLCRPSGRVNYADALTNADARAHRVGKLYTFEERFPSEGLALERPR